MPRKNSTADDVPSDRLAAPAAPMAKAAAAVDVAEDQAGPAEVVEAEEILTTEVLPTRSERMQVCLAFIVSTTSCWLSTKSLGRMVEHQRVHYRLWQPSSRPGRSNCIEQDVAGVPLSDQRKSLDALLLRTGATCPSPWICTNIPSIYHKKQYSDVLPDTSSLALQTAAWRLLLYGIRSSGAAFIKWGQWSATREDIFPTAFCRVLAELHDRAPVHSWEASKIEIEAAFGKSVEELFESIDHEPLASGSVAQVWGGK